MDVKIAKPRNDTSPNFKAFHSNVSTTHGESIKIKPLNKSQLNYKNISTSCSEFLSPLVLPKPNELKNEPSDHFSIGKTFNVSKVNDNNRYNDFIRRFSHQSAFSSVTKNNKESSTQRFSLEYGRQTSKRNS